MKRNKFKEFYSIGNNTYSVLKFGDDLFIGTESFLRIPRKRRISQGFKVLEMTAPISYLFDRIISADLISEDKEFPDMNKYAIVDNKQLRKDLKEMYESTLESEIDYLLNDFKNWCNNFEEENSAILPADQISRTIASNRSALNANIDIIKKNHKETSPVFNAPRITDSKDLYNLSQLERFEFLYTQKVGSNLKFSYFYDLDDFGVVTIYKVQTVKGYVKSIETFIYNREIISRLIKYMEKHKM